MKNRYLFKAKRVDNGEWVQGALVYDNRDKMYRIVVEIHCSTGTCITTYNTPRVDSSTICQCTGMTDKNGNLIWENDILMCYDNADNLVKVAYGEFDVIDADSLNVSDSVIGWHHEVVSMDALNKCELFRYDMLPLTEYYIQLMEAKRIKNVFDNPELRGEGNE